MIEILPLHYIILSLALFLIGMVGVLARKNIFVILMSIELMLNGGNLAFITFARLQQDAGGQVAVLFIIALAAAEISIGLALVVALFRLKKDLNLDNLTMLKG